MKPLQCANCHKQIKPGQTILKVFVIFGDGHQSYAPCCCEDCASKVKTLYRRIHAQNAALVENEKFQKIKAEEFAKSFFDRGF